ncbi:condensation domain-containing protein, partial [Planctomycetota bacterium]|nr:condensation domain-containing protein [Planctomycetota bacterium]
IFELFVPLSSGGTVLLVEDALAWAERPGPEAPCLINTVPSAARALLEADALPAEVLAINLAGEPLTAELAAGLQARAPQARLHNLYGPTEYTTYATGCALEPGEAVTIGRPIGNTQIYVLDEWLEPVPTGVPGEICIAGAGLARGYAGRPVLTAAAFVPDPWGRPGERMYRTGDLGRFGSDGKIQFLGRRDYQVKIRGYRIELGEIESTLRQCPGVTEAVAVARPAGEGQDDLRLTAYVCGEAIETGALRTLLSERLPSPMVPSDLVVLKGLPRTPNGKLDRVRLPEPDSEVAGEYVAPRTATEAALSEIFAAVLRRERVGVHDDFFASGGHSLLAAQVATRIRERLACEVQLRDLFSARTVAGLAPRLGERRQREAIERADRPQRASFAQQRLWFLAQLEPNTVAYNLPAAWRIVGRLEVEALEWSVGAVVARHEVLRTTFAAEDGVPHQVVHSPGQLAWRAVEAGAGGLEPLLEEEAGRVFDLESGPLFRACLFEVGPEDHVLLLTAHHVVFDGWSFGVLCEELRVLYAARVAGRESPLPELPVQYADYAAWQRRRLRGPALGTQLDYWRRTLKDAPRALDLPTDRPRPPVPSYGGAWVDFELGAELTRGLRELSREANATLFMTVAAGFSALLQRITGENDLCIAYPVAGRRRLELEGLLGFFVNTLILRTQLTPGQSAAELLAQVRGAVL